jgi:hypothetical protein
MGLCGVLKTLSYLKPHLSTLTLVSVVTSTCSTKERNTINFLCFQLLTGYDEAQGESSTCKLVHTK